MHMHDEVPKICGGILNGSRSCRVKVVKWLKYIRSYVFIYDADVYIYTYIYNYNAHTLYIYILLYLYFS